MTERYTIRGGQQGYDRLQILARAVWPDTADLLDRIGVCPGMDCLDLGCGSGDVTLQLAALVGPDGRVVGVDVDEVKLGLARGSAAARGLANVEFRQADATNWQESDAHDLVYSRYLLQHLSRPVDLLRRMLTAVRPGGVLAVEDADFDGIFCDPPNEGFAWFGRTYARLLQHHGGDAAIGRKLFRLFLEAEIPDPEVRPRAGVTSSGGERKALMLGTLEATADAAVAAGLATPDEVESARASLAAFTDDPRTLIGNPPTFQVWARRPRSAGEPSGPVAP
jgi:ubiquinone/menaquinone biosynthesis C-methylase UbiE